MNIDDMKYITINKNRGWRGLAEVTISDNLNIVMTKHIFSFSQDVWDDMMYKNIIVIADDKYYYVIHFASVIRGLLPRQDQQRSVLIKNFKAEINNVNKIKKEEWSKSDTMAYLTILHFIKNKNNHTQSDWNCIGLRVIPEI